MELCKFAVMRPPTRSKTKETAASTARPSHCAEAEAARPAVTSARAAARAGTRPRPARDVAGYRLSTRVKEHIGRRGASRSGGYAPAQRGRALRHRERRRSASSGLRLNGRRNAAHLRLRKPRAHAPARRAGGPRLRTRKRGDIHRENFIFFKIRDVKSFICYINDLMFLRVDKSPCSATRSRDRSRAGRRSPDGFRRRSPTPRCRRGHAPPRHNPTSRDED
ncbi:hypothetical protein EVAR_65619_1 [Eumeta japonica]|uniref:Uncharacterized protein n=1 Tax=Eumeta variegata TaxID=151549 RepID=A0A4C1Z428_EUMVA|nr:hypothetical protein EVAR_65619_1 [Eumeta japonica]